MKLRCAPKLRRRATGRGFTLLEAVVALAIAALALGVMSRVVGQGAFVTTALAARQQAAMVAQSVLASATYAEDWGQQPQGESPPWSWRVTVEPQTLVLAPETAQASATSIVAARVSVDVWRTDDPTARFTLTGWKPYRAAP
jgi:general secretion pathway protein I